MQEPLVFPLGHWGLELQYSSAAQCLFLLHDFSFLSPLISSAEESAKAGAARNAVASATSKIRLNVFIVISPFNVRPPTRLAYMSIPAATQLR